MPEGHTIHRAARTQFDHLGGQALAVSSPQGRATETAALLDGRVLTAVDAYGKHLLYRFEDAPGALHVHLGLFGRFLGWERAEAPPPRMSRMRFVGDGHVYDLAAPTVCSLLDPAEEDTLIARLGPDPLRDDADPDRAFTMLRRKKVPLGAALLDQSVIAGIGNAFRAEILHACGLPPRRAAKALTRPQFDRLWTETVDQLRRGEREGAIPDKRVYKRDECGTCGGPTRSAEVASRTLFWCPACQSGRKRS